MNFLFDFMGVIADRLKLKIQGLRKGLENDADDLRKLTDDLKQVREQLEKTK